MGRRRRVRREGGGGSFLSFRFVRSFSRSVFGVSAGVRRVSEGGWMGRKEVSKVVCSVLSRFGAGVGSFAVSRSLLSSSSFVGFRKTTGTRSLSLSLSSPFLFLLPYSIVVVSVLS